LFGNFVFIFGGRLIAQKINSNTHILNWIIGGIFALTAIIQLYKILKKKDATHQLEHPEELQQKFEHELEGIEKLEHLKKHKDDNQN
jgi:hypothetical protein